MTRQITKTDVITVVLRGLDQADRYLQETGAPWEIQELVRRSSILAQMLGVWDERDNGDIARTECAFDIVMRAETKLAEQQARQR